jgi:hypothetical protein
LKETTIHIERDHPTHWKRPPYTLKETTLHIERDHPTHWKRPPYTLKETTIHTLFEQKHKNAWQNIINTFPQGHQGCFWLENKKAEINKKKIKKIAEPIYTPFQNCHFILSVLTCSASLGKQFSEQNSWNKLNIWEKSSLDTDNNLTFILKRHKTEFHLLPQRFPFIRLIQGKISQTDRFFINFILCKISQLTDFLSSLSYVKYLKLTWVFIKLNK